MKSPALVIWAMEIKAHLRENNEPITPEEITTHMIFQDAPEVRDFFFGGIPPKNPNNLSSIIARIETIKFVATKVVVN
jgi:hypothetical protein